MTTKRIDRQKAAGMSLVETLTSVGIGCALMALIAGFFVFSFKGIAGLANYATMEYACRKALDQISFSIRQAHAVTSASTNSVQLQMVKSDGTQGNVSFEYDAAAGTLEMINENGDMQRLLENCTSLAFSFFQRPAPGDDWNNLRGLSTNSPSICKVIQVRWKCERKLMGSLVNTEIMESTKIVLRTSNWKTDQYNFN